MAPQILPPSTSSITEKSLDSYRAIVDSMVADNQVLYDQQADLKAQILDLNKQLNVVNKQIADLETDDVKRAKLAVQVLTKLDSPTILRELGI